MQRASERLNYQPNLRAKSLRQRRSNIVGLLIPNVLNRYTPAQGSIRLELVEGDGWAQFRVTDTGIGIPAEDIPHIGEEFFRGKNLVGRNIQGTGLGMSIVKELVKRFRGRIVIERQLGQGTTFEFAFPISLLETDKAG